MKNNVVEVKQEHIDNGVKGCPCYCAVSLAVYDALEDKYKFSPIRLGDADSMREAVEVGESWVETAVCGGGAEISIFTKIRGIGCDMVVEEYIAIEDERSSGVMMNDIVLEGWIEGFDTFDNSEPISFKIQDIHIMDN